MRNQDSQRVGYIGEMTVEFAELARTDGLELLAYLLEMAALEAGLASKKCNDAQRR